MMAKIATSVPCRIDGVLLFHHASRSATKNDYASIIRDRTMKQCIRKIKNNPNGYLQALQICSPSIQTIFCLWYYTAVIFQSRD